MKKNTETIQSRIEKIFQTFTQPGSPGCAVAIIKDGQIIFDKGFGLANLEINSPITSSSVFNIGSIAKQFTAFAIALLIDEGKLSLDDPLCKHLPELPMCYQEVNIRHLIHHISGIRDSFPALLTLAEWRDSDNTTSEDVYKLLKKQKNLNFEPGSKFEYSNSNYILLAKICKQVKGQSFSEFCRENIFKPLNMQDTRVNDSVYDLIPKRALGYYENDTGGWINAPLVDSVTGSTNIYTSVLDLMKWEQNFFSPTIGSKTVHEMIIQPGKLNNGEDLDYAFGLEVGANHQHHGWQMVEHGGSHGGYASSLIRFPEANLSIAVLFNNFRWNARDYALRVAEFFLDIHSDTQNTPDEPVEIHERIELSQKELQQRCGKYFNEERGAIRSIAISDNGNLQYEGLNLIPIARNLFYFEVEPQTKVEFFPTEKNKAKEIRTITSSGTFHYIYVETVTPDFDELKAYTGDYYSAELDIIWMITLKDDHLEIQRRKHPNSNLIPLFSDAFQDDWSALVGFPLAFQLRFTRNKNNQIAGLLVAGDGVRNLEFERVMITPEFISKY